MMVATGPRRPTKDFVMSSERANRVFLILLALFSGACVMTVEMAGQRSLTPHFGSSTYVWTNVIGVILAALSVGYMVGGRLADRKPEALVLFSVVTAAGVVSLLIPFVVHPLGNAMIPEGVRQASAFRIVYLGSFLITLLLFAPPVFLLGMVSPFIVRLLTRDKEEVGRSSGVVYACSTVGSILGTFLPTLVLIPWIGTSRTMLLAAGVLCIFGGAGFLVRLAGRKRSAAALLFVPLAAGPVTPLPSPRGGEETLAETESRFQYVRVYTREEARVLSLNEGLQTYHSLMVPGRALTGGTHFDFFNLLPLYFDPGRGERLRVFIGGLAAGIMSRQIHHFFGRAFRLEVDGAEIDEAVLEMGRRYFELDGPANRNLEARAADARVFLARTRGPYDLVILDAYANQMYIPFQLTTREFFELARSRLAPGGVLGINAADFGPDATLLSAVRNTLAEVFGRVEQVEIPAGMNYLLIARRGEPVPADVLKRRMDRAAFLSRPEARILKPLLVHAAEAREIHYPVPGGIVLTDDRAPVEALMDASFRQAREEMIASLGEAESGD